MVRWSFILALIPVVPFAIAGMAATKKAPAPVVAVDTGPRVVKTESIITFDGRWAPFASPPPAIEREEIRDAARGAADAVPGAVVAAPQPAMPSRDRLRSQRARLDICARHNMRKVTYHRGRWSGWRCRR